MRQLIVTVCNVATACPPGFAGFTLHFKEELILTCIVEKLPRCCSDVGVSRNVSKNPSTILAKSGTCLSFLLRVHVLLQFDILLHCWIVGGRGGAGRRLRVSPLATVGDIFIPRFNLLRLALGEIGVLGRLFALRSRSRR